MIQKRCERRRESIFDCDGANKSYKSGGGKRRCDCRRHSQRRVFWHWGDNPVFAPRRPRILSRPRSVSTPHTLRSPFYYTHRCRFRGWSGWLPHIQDRTAMRLLVALAAVLALTPACVDAQLGTKDWMDRCEESDISGQNIPSQKQPKTTHTSFLPRQPVYRSSQPTTRRRH